MTQRAAHIFLQFKTSNEQVPLRARELICVSFEQEACAERVRTVRCASLIRQEQASWSSITSKLDRVYLVITVFPSCFKFTSLIKFENNLTSPHQDDVASANSQVQTFNHTVSHYITRQKSGATVEGSFLMSTVPSWE